MRLIQATRETLKFLWEHTGKENFFVVCITARDIFLRELFLGEVENDK